MALDLVDHPQPCSHFSTKSTRLSFPAVVSSHVSREVNRKLGKTQNKGCTRRRGACRRGEGA